VYNEPWVEVKALENLLMLANLELGNFKRVEVAIFIHVT